MVNFILISSLKCKDLDTILYTNYSTAESRTYDKTVYLTSSVLCINYLDTEALISDVFCLDSSTIHLMNELWDASFVDF